MNSAGGGAHTGREITRRDFGRTLGATVMAASIGQSAVHASDKAGTRPPVFGRGEHTCEVVPGWCKLPEGRKFGNTHGVAEDAQGRILIHNQSPTGDVTCVFDADGRFIKSWGKDLAPGAHGMTLHREGGTEYLYLAATSLHAIYKATLDGEIVWKKGAPPLADVYADEAKYVPTNIALAPNGDFYVADGYGQHYVHQYSAKGDYIRSWGGLGTEPGKMNCPHGIWVDTRGEQPLVVVADRANVRLQYFTLDGKHVRFVSNDLRYPCHFRIRGSDMLIPDLHSRVTIFDKDNKAVAQLGIGAGDREWTKPQGYPNVPHERREVGRFIAPHDACWDSKGNMYVVEWVPDGRVTKLRRVSA